MVDLIRSDDTFKFQVPMSFNLEKGGENGNAAWKIRGYASTPATDRQGEQIIQSGLNIEPFIKHGWFNYDHNNTEILGYPDKEATKMTDKGLYVEGTLLKNNPLSAKLWNLANELEKSGAPRKLGMSVEGKIHERGKDGRILKADIYNVALTPSPVNPEATFEAFAKSFTVPLNRPDTFDVYGQYKTVQEGFNSCDEKVEAALCDKVYNGDGCDGGYPQDKISAAFNVLSELASYTKGREYLKERLNLEGMNADQAVLYLQIITGVSREEAVKHIIGKIL